MESSLEGLQRLLSQVAYQVGDRAVSVSSVLAALLALLVGWLAARRLRAAAGRMFKASSEEEEGTSAVAEPVAFWLTLGAACLLALELLGMEWSLAGSLTNTPVFTLSGTPVTLATIITVIFVLGLTWVLSRVLRRWASHALALRGVDAGTQGIAKRLLHYSIMAIGVALALDNLGINLAALFAAGAVFAVGIGFAMQNIAQNFVSGLILLIERTIKPGDVIEVEGQMMVVEAMGIRSTVARSRDEEEMIIPNATLVQNTVKNYTLRDSLYRIRASVGVAYESDMRQVRRVLEEAARGVEMQFPGREPVLLLKEFGSSSVEFELSIWVTDPWGSAVRRSQLMEAIWWGLADAGITIAFPQVDVHLDAPIEEALGRLPRAS